MPSTNKLFSLGQSQRSSRHVVSNIAKFLLSFCGIASFGVVTMLSLTSFSSSPSLLPFSPLASILLSTNNASATSATGSTSNNVSVGISSSVAIRLLDSTATFDITRLDFDLTPTASGVTTTKRTVVDVATSNPTGYKLYMQSNYQDHSGNYTTNLVHSYTDVSDYIPSVVPGSGGVSSSATLYWNYINPLLSTTSIIPPHGTPDKIAQLPTQTNSDQTPVDINVSVDTSIVSGTYTNQLLFSAVANPSPVSYSISFDGNGGSPVPSTITGSATSSTFSIPLDSTIPTKLGYTFSHWEITSVSSTSPTPDINPTATCNSTSTCNPGDSLDISSYGEPGVVVALTAVYTINTHTVTITNGTGIASTTITCNNNSSNTTNTCTYGDTVTISATPATGYSFDSNTGWSIVSGGVTVENGQFTMPDSDVAITADAVKMYSYTFQWEANAGSESVSGLPNLQNYPRQTLSSYTITIPSGTPTRAGYTFTGYNTKPDGSGTTYQPGNTITGYSSSAGSTPTADGYPVNTVLYARWSRNKTLVEICGEASPETTFTYDGIQYIKLYTNAAKTTTACYTKSSQGTATWANASSLCPSGTGVPSKTDFDNLITAYGSSSGLNNATGWGPGSSYTGYWSSTEYNSARAYGLRVRSSTTTVYGYYVKSDSYNVVCIVPPTIANSTYFQEVTSCPSTLPTGTEYTLTDQGQTSKTYKAAKLADNKCWMTTNYNHTAGALSSTYYNVSSSGYTIPPSKCDASGTNQFAGYCDGTSDSSTSAYGGYYDWTVATAGSSSTTYSICPKGWRLPTEDELTNLVSKYNASSQGSNLVTGDPKMQYGGYCSPGSYACGRASGGYGTYWSSTVSGSNSYYLYVGSSSAYTTATYRYYGISVRCVFGS